MEMTELERRELEQSLRRDLEQLVRDEAKSEVPLVPRRFEVGFGSERSAPELQRGLDLGDGIVLSGKIDRIDVDPGSARGIVQDYKSGRTGHSAVEIEKELRLQIPLYMLVLRDLVGIEPLGGLYRPLAGERRPRGLLRLEAREDGIPGFAPKDYLDEEAFWGRVEGARELARGFAQRIQAGDVRHDPKGGECPAWCDLWRMCRIKRA
jgi:RecB family exonuclease